jgi:hypothetical protein
MESNIINIATLTIDRTEAADSIVKTKQEIFELQKANAELRKDILKNGDATGEQTKQFVENEAELKKLTAQYRTQQNAINDVTLAEIKNSAALTQNAKTIDQANAQNKELLKTRNQIDASTTEGAEAIALLNAKLDQNKEFIIANGNASEKAANITGNYRQKIFELSSSLDNSIPGFQQARTVVAGFASIVGESADAVTNYTNSAIQSTRATLGFKTASQTAAQTTAVQTTATEAQAVAQTQVTVATAGTTVGMKLLKAAIISTGIGALVILLVSVFTALSQSETASNKFSKALAGFKGILNAVFAVLKPLGEFLIDKIVAAFELAGEVAEKTLGLISKGLNAIGFTNAAKSVDNFTKSVKGSIQATQQLADAEAKFNAAQRQSQKIQLDFQRQAEKLRQLRDDESKSIPERIKANNALGATLKQQASDELRIANQGVAIANLRIKLTGRSKDNLDELAQAETKVSDIRERISGQESEQLTNLNSLRKEAADKAKEQAAAERERKLKALNDTVIVFEGERKTVEAQLAFYQNYYAQLDKLQNGSDRIKNAADFSAKVLDIANKTIADELAAQTKVIEEKKALSLQERDELIANADFLKKTETERVKSQLLTEVDKAKVLEEIQKGYLANVAAINQTFEESEKMRKQEQEALDAIAFETRLLTIQEQGIAESDIRRQILLAEYEEKQRLIALDLENEKITAKEATAIRLLEEKRYAQATKAIDKEVAKTKRDAQFGIAQQAIAAAQLIFGESKALSVASALINTYQGITAELSTKAVTPYEIGLKVANVAFVAASGFAAVKNILKTDKGSSAGGSGGAGGGTTSTPAAVFENPARTATVATVDAAPNQEDPQAVQTVLVLETLDEAKNQQQIKIKST